MKIKSGVSVFVFIGVIVCALGAEAATVTYGFQHFSDNRNRTISVEADPGDTLEFVISETCADSFTFRMLGIERQPAAEDREGAFAAPNQCAADDTETLSIVVGSAYSGYLVEIVPRDNVAEGFLRREGAEVVCTEENDDCKSASRLTLVLLLAEDPWNIEFAGGFAFSDLTDPRYGARTENVGGAPQSVVVRDSGAEDSMSLGLVAMIHATPRRFPKLAASFGLGVGDDSSTDYFLGASYRAGGRFFITVGKHWGAVERLKTGLQVGDVLADPNDLNSLPTRTDSGFFLSVTYSFLDPGANAFRGGFAPASGDGGE